MYFHRQSDPSQYISPWHDIPLLSSSSPSPAPTSSSSPSSRLYHYVNEIPLHSTAKMEVSTKEPHNPIAQDIKKGKLRHFTYGSIPFNYGCLPQTWEDPTVVHPDTQCLGDNDPLDVVELSPTPPPHRLRQHRPPARRPRAHRRGRDRLEAARPLHSAPARRARPLP